MKSKNQKHLRKLAHVNCTVFLYNNITRVCVTKSYEDGTSDEIEKLYDDSFDKLCAQFSSMKSKTIGITIYNFKEYDYFK